MEQGRVDDWACLPGAHVEVRLLGTPVCSGIVDTVTDDGTILWILTVLDGRRLFEKAELYEVWAAEERIGFHYRMALLR